MRTAARVGLVLSCFVAIDVAASEVSLSVSPSSTSQVKLAVQRLERYLRQQPSDVAGRIIVARWDEPDPSIGDQGYELSSRESTLYVRANSEAGLANGVYTLLRTLMVEDLVAPTDRDTRMNAANTCPKEGIFESALRTARNHAHGVADLRV